MTTKTNDIVTTLLNSYKEKEPLSFLNTDGFSTEASFYEVQHEFIQRKIEDTHEGIKGYKISLTNKGLQEIFHTDSPIYGTLMDSTVVDDVIHKKELFDPLLETEIMFIITEDISPFATVSEIIEKSLIAPGLEIPDSRINDWFPKLSIGELIMDNAVTGKIVVGDPIKLNTEINLENISMTLYHNDEKVVSGKSNFVLDNPLNAVEWLNNKLSTQGNALRKGMIISSGTFISPIPLALGTYRAVYDHFGEVKLNVKE
jgi:2-keto-4-pentenoate hydratase